MHRLDGPAGGGSGRPAAPAPAAAERGSKLLGPLLGLGLALLVHAAAFVALREYSKWKLLHPEPTRINLPVEVAMVEKPKPPPPPPPEEKPKPPPPKPKPIPLKLARKLPPPPKDVPPPPPKNTPPPPPSDKPPPPNVEAKGPPSKETPRIIAGLTMESTTQGGTFAAQVGNTLYGTPGKTAVAPSEVKPYKAAEYRPSAQVTELPGLIEGSLDLRRYYPDAARKREFEGDVVLRVLIDSDGTVAKATIVSDPGEGLGHAALEAAKSLRFRPAKVNGTAVATTVPFTLHFRLNN